MAPTLQDLQESNDIAVVVQPNQSKKHVLIKLLPSHTDKSRKPVNICCVIDISGSMADIAKVQSSTGTDESNGLSILDLVKHSVRTIMATMNPEDDLSIVSFSDDAELVLNTTKMDKNGKNKAEAVLNKLQPTCSTNIWAGLEKGLNVLRENDHKTLPALLLFTDGQPNVEPPRGHIPMLKMYKDKHGLPCIINTFGFGYNLDSTLLYKLAYEGCGSYTFIPDGGLVGTAFINSTANLYNIRALNASVSVELINGATISTNNPVMGGFPHVDSSWGTTVDIGSIQLEQSKDVIIKLDKMAPDQLPSVSVTLKYNQVPTGKLVTISNQVDVSNQPLLDDKELEAQYHRLQFVDTIMEVHKKQSRSKLSFDDSKKIVANLSKEITKNNDQRVDALLKDIEGQVLLSIEPNFWKKWGRHYLLSLLMAHRQQQCNNFKDPGVQVYGSETFNNLRDEFDEIFRKLPAPKPAVAKKNAAPVNMRNYHYVNNGCFHGDCYVLDQNDDKILVRNVRKGQVLKTDQGFSNVSCVIKMNSSEDVDKLVELEGGLKITPWHPIMYDGKWCFPNEVSSAVNVKCDAVFTFVLEKDHVVLVNGVPCVTLGHGFKDDVREHDFFGTQKVIQNLKMLSGWDEGFVVASGHWRDEKGNVCKIGEC
ncbi:developmentally-regulated vWFA domain protein [Acrasis kona]|uniref:Developmentally-regulated vWFA domain protein n=1 Tax=Acrasis kona TaxID=1008807 RepID=A0AAW2ZAK2_9EUKA